MFWINEDVLFIYANKYMSFGSTGYYRNIRDFYSEVCAVLYWLWHLFLLKLLLFFRSSSDCHRLHVRNHLHYSVAVSRHIKKQTLKFWLNWYFFQKTIRTKNLKFSKFEYSTTKSFWKSTFIKKSSRFRSPPFKHVIHIRSYPVGGRIWVRQKLLPLENAQIWWWMAKMQQWSNTWNRANKETRHWVSKKKLVFPKQQQWHRLYIYWVANVFSRIFWTEKYLAIWPWFTQSILFFIVFYMPIFRTNVLMRIHKAYNIQSNLFNLKILDILANKIWSLTYMVCLVLALRCLHLIKKLDLIWPLFLYHSLRSYPIICLFVTNTCIFHATFRGRNHSIECNVSITFLYREICIHHS